MRAALLTVLLAACAPASPLVRARTPALDLDARALDRGAVHCLVARIVGEDVVALRGPPQDWAITGVAPWRWWRASAAEAGWADRVVRGIRVAGPDPNARGGSSTGTDRPEPVGRLSLDGTASLNTLLAALGTAPAPVDPPVCLHTRAVGDDALRDALLDLAAGLAAAEGLPTGDDAGDPGLPGAPGTGESRRSPAHGGRGAVASTPTGALPLRSAGDDGEAPGARSDALWRRLQAGRAPGAPVASLRFVALTRDTERDSAWIDAGDGLVPLRLADLVGAEQLRVLAIGREMVLEDVVGGRWRWPLGGAPAPDTR